MNNNDNNNNNKESSKRQKSSLKPMGVAPVEEVVEPDDGSFIVAGIRMMKPRESQIVWAKLPGHPHWPGLRVDEVKHGDVVPKAAKQMQKDGNDVCVVFFGEKSFGWLPETSIVAFEVGYKQHSHAPVRGKARFLNALKYANAEKELRKNEAKNGLTMENAKKSSNSQGWRCHRRHRWCQRRARSSGQPDGRCRTDRLRSRREEQKRGGESLIRRSMPV